MDIVRHRCVADGYARNADALHNVFTHGEFTYPDGGKEDARPVAQSRSPLFGRHPAPISAVRCTPLGLTANPAYPCNDPLAFVFPSGNRKA